MGEWRRNRNGEIGDPLIFFSVNSVFSVASLSDFDYEPIG